MRELPILFSAPMVRAILVGKKTETRRIIKPQPSDEWCPEVGLYNPIIYDRFNEMQPGPEVFGASDENEGRVCPYGRPGDRLWVRETWGFRARRWRGIEPDVKTYVFAYKSDDSRRELAMPDNWDEKGLPKQRDRRDEESEWDYSDYLSNYWRRWRPSIHMPRVASRIDLEIVSVRVDALNDITEDEARHEGIEEANSINAFAHLWESINGIGTWGLNPWVWIIEFKLLEVRT